MTDLRSELRSATSSSHTAIESNERLSLLLSSDLNEAAYVDVLRRYYGFFAPLEREMMASPFVVDDMSARLKTPALVQDLRGDISSLPVSSTLPSVATLGTFMGVLYVLEGSALGGMQIAKHLAAFGFTEGRRSFFVADGPAVSLRWRRFLELLASVPAPEWPDAVASATRTFELLDSWMAGA